MNHRVKRDIPYSGFFFLTLGFCVLLIALTTYLALCHGGNDLYAFSEPVLELTDGWTLTDSTGAAREISLPLTIEYGTDGRYALSRTLPEMDGLTLSPAFAFYSNYVDVRILLDGVALYDFPSGEAAFNGATGNTYHFVRIPADCGGQTLTVELRCQLGPAITYLLNPPQLGPKAPMLNQAVMQSLPAFTLAGCMCMLALGLGALYFAFRRRLSLNQSTLYTALFALLFAAYVLFETRFAQLLVPNGYLLCLITLALLALMPVPLIGIFADAVSGRFKPVMYLLMLLCALNLTVQLILNFFGVASVRVLLPATHAVIVLSIAVAALCMFRSDRAERPRARAALLSAAPMIAGGLADIVLLSVNHPSLNNCFWFSLGVTVFIIQQMWGFAGSYLSLYRASLEAKMLASMAYHDALAGVDNRNAYERKLKELNRGAPSERLCCIVLDINDLKRINDSLGHQAGDEAIAEVGAALRECMPKDASYFRTGGDEFVVLLEGGDERRARALAERLSEEAARRGKACAVPISLAVGCGQYAAEDGGVLDFIRRVDTLMYECKRGQKAVSACADARRD